MKFTTLLLLTLSCAVSFGKIENSKLDDFEKNTRCQVRRTMEHTSGLGRCYGRDEVLVEITTVNPLIVRCAKLEVTCPNRADSLAADLLEDSPE